MAVFHTVFVYGTLRPGFKENEARLAGSMFDLGWYPGVKLDRTDNTEVVVEKVVVDEETLERLDHYEGYDASRPETSLYHRVEVEIGDEKGWLYTYNGEPPVEHLIPNGDWLTYCGSEKGSNSHLITEKGVIA